MTDTYPKFIDGMRMESMSDEVMLGQLRATHGMYRGTIVYGQSKSCPIANWNPEPEVISEPRNRYSEEQARRAYYANGERSSLSQAIWSGVWGGLFYGTGLTVALYCLQIPAPWFYLGFPIAMCQRAFRRWVCYR